MLKLNFTIVLCMYLSVFTYPDLFPNTFIFLIFKAQITCDKGKEEKIRMIFAYFWSEKLYCS